VTTSPVGAGGRPDSDGWQQRFMDEMEALSVTPPTAPALMRVLAYMAVCQPREQTASQIQDELGLSAGSVSSAFRRLQRIGVIERTAQQGSRRVFYRFAEQGWERLLQARFRTLSELRRVADRAVDAAGPHPDPRLIRMRETSRAVEDGMAALLNSEPG